MTSPSEPEQVVLGLGISDAGHVVLTMPNGTKMGFTPEQARAFADKLNAQAKLIEDGVHVKVN